MEEAGGLSEALLGSPKRLSSFSGADIPDTPGYYAIFVDSTDSLPEPFRSDLERRSTRLIYIGIATVSLRRRLWEQDTEHKHPSTFFRGVAPILGFRPPAGSLVHRENKNNYFFSRDDTVQIIAWMKEHLSASWVEDGSADKRVEAEVIKRNAPLLNTTHNPRKSQSLALLRSECRLIAIT